MSYEQVTKGMSLRTGRRSDKKYLDPCLRRNDGLNRNSECIPEINKSGAAAYDAIVKRGH